MSQSIRRRLEEPENRALRDNTSDMLRQSAATFLVERHSTRRLRSLRTSAHGYECSLWRDMAALGWMSMLLPDDLGGLGMDVRHVAALCDEIGAALLPEPWVACALMPAVVMRGAPASRRRDSLLEAIGSGDAMLALAWQEHENQIDPAEGIEALVSGTPGALRLSGLKRFVASLPGADGLIVSARQDGETALVHVPAGVSGMHVTEHRLVDDSRAANVVFDDLPLAADAILARGALADALLRQAFEESLVAVCAQQVAIARRGLEITTEYMRTRVQFGRALASFQALQHRLVDLAIQVRRMEAALARAVQYVQEGNPDRPAVLSAAKSFCTGASLRITRACIQLHGGMGFTDEADIGLYLRAALRLAGWLGTADAHRERFMALREPPQGPGGAGDAPDGARSMARARKPVELPAPREGRWPDYNAMSDEDFRAVFRDWLENNLPQENRRPADRLLGEPAESWMRKLSQAGWRAPGWPVKFGGLGLSFRKHAIYHEELDRAGASRWIDHGVWSLGEILMHYGDDAQRDYYLPRILTCEHVWAQGYSEPGAGSDLASLRTRAVRDGGHWMINGQKIWTSGAAYATHIFVLVRTNPDTAKQRGISFILADIKTPGITVRPIRNIADELEFCEVFFEDARVPLENLVGEVDQGWTIAKGLLGMERLVISSSSLPRRALAALRAVGRRRELLADPLFRSRYGELLMDIENLEALYAEASEDMGAGREVPTDLSILRIFAGELFQQVSEAAMEFAAEHGPIGSVSTDGVQHDIKKLFMVARPATIYGGTAEIQRNILARRLLSLPDQ